MIKTVNGLVEIKKEMIKSEQDYISTGLIVYRPVVGIVVSKYNDDDLFIEDHILQDYQPIYKSYFTTIYVSSCQQMSFKSSDNLLLTKKSMNILNANRQYVTSINDPRRGRFTWILLKSMPTLDNMSPELIYSTIIIDLDL